MAWNAGPSINGGQQQSDKTAGTQRRQLGVEGRFVSEDMGNDSNAFADWGALGLLSLSMAAAVLLRGGVYPTQWAWSAIGIALALLLVAGGAKSGRVGATPDVAAWLLGGLAVWMALPLVPLPPSLVAVLSPERWSAVLAARTFTGENPRDWVALSVAPGATFERLADVVPAMTAFFAIRTLSSRWRSSQWLLVAPVILIAWLQSLLGMLQFRAARAAGGVLIAVSGTYVNRDHFAALLEMSFPLALLWAVSLWHHSNARRTGALRPVLANIGLVAVAACLLLGITFSASRMAFVSTAGAGALIVGLSFTGRSPLFAQPRMAWRWVAAIALPAFLFAALPTRQLLDRFLELARGDALAIPRVEIWRDSLPMIAAYKWVGCGLGAFEYGFYRFNSRLPMDTVDFAHNDYLQIVAELGLVGAGLVAALALCIISGLVTLARRASGAENWELVVGLLGALFAIGLHSFAEFNLYIPANALVVAWLCGIADSRGLSQRSFLT